MTQGGRTPGAGTPARPAGTPARPAGRGTPAGPPADRRPAIWAIAVPGIFARLLVLALLGVPSRLCPQPTPAPLPTLPPSPAFTLPPSAPVTPTPGPAASPLVSPAVSPSPQASPIT